MKRVVTGALLGTGWLFLLWSDHFLLFWLVLLAAGGAALQEYGAMLRKRHGAAGFRAVEVLGLLLPGFAFFQRVDWVTAALVLAVILLLVFVLAQHSRWSDPLELALWGVFGLVLVGLPVAHFVLLMAKPGGGAWLLVVTLLSTASDTAAYYAGSRWGKTKLCPAISPGKTRVGLAGGVAGGVLVGTIAACWLFPAIHVGTMILIALLLSLLGTAGDLTESMVKRAAGVKDSGTLLPGHGGVLDRTDSLLLMVPLLFYLVHFGLLPGA